MLNMFGMMIETYARDIVEVNNKWYIVDTIKPGDTNRWETGLTKIDTEAMKEWLDDECEGELDKETILEFCEEFTTDWDVEQHLNKRTAIKRHKEICKTAELH